MEIKILWHYLNKPSKYSFFIVNYILISDPIRFNLSDDLWLQDASTHPIEACQTVVSDMMHFNRVALSLIKTHSSLPGVRLKLAFCLIMPYRLFLAFLNMEFLFLVRIVFLPLATYLNHLTTVQNYRCPSTGQLKEYLGMVSKYQCKTFQAILKGSQSWEPLFKRSASRTLT